MPCDASYIKVLARDLCRVSAVPGGVIAGRRRTFRSATDGRDPARPYTYLHEIRTRVARIIALDDFAVESWHPLRRALAVRCWLMAAFPLRDAAKAMLCTKTPSKVRARGTAGASYKLTPAATTPAAAYLLLASVRESGDLKARAAVKKD